MSQVPILVKRALFSFRLGILKGQPTVPQIPSLPTRVVEITIISHKNLEICFRMNSWKREAHLKKARSIISWPSGVGMLPRMKRISWSLPETIMEMITIRWEEIHFCSAKMRLRT